VITTSLSEDDVAGIKEIASELRVISEEEMLAEWDDARPWPALQKYAFHGLAGDIVHGIGEETEADPVALLLTLLVCFGNMVGPRPHLAILGDQHPARLFVTLVGGTASGGKGTSKGAIWPILKECDPNWAYTAPVSGFASGEAIVARLGGYHQAPGTEGQVEKRALVFEPEFARLLTINSREGSTSSPVIRGAWDDGRLQLVRAQKSLLAEDTHVSILGHITPDELRAKLTNSEVLPGSLIDLILPL